MLISLAIPLQTHLPNHYGETQAALSPWSPGGSATSLTAPRRHPAALPPSGLQQVHPPGARLMPAPGRHLAALPLPLTPTGLQKVLPPE